MSRSVPAALLAYMQGHGIHMVKIVKVGPLPDGTYRPFAMCAKDVVYDDGEASGELTYIARTGAQMSDFVTASDLGVDNAEMDSLPPVDAFPLEGITTEQIQSGVLDKTPYVVYALNPLDTSLGHFIWSGGTIGEVRIKNSALINLEQRSLSNQLKQMIVDVDSTTCRAKFGSQFVQNSSGDAIIERQPCEYDVDPEWVSATVSTVDSSDSDMLFTSASLTQIDDYFAPGLTEWLTGDNVGIQREVGAYSSDSNEGTVRLSYATPHPIQVGDTFRIRRECTKHWTGHNSCDTYWGANKTLHFRGEPAIPIGDTAANLISGAGVSGDIGGTGEEL